MNNNFKPVILGIDVGAYSVARCIYEHYNIKSIIVGKGNASANTLHKRVSNLVKAHTQVLMYEAVQDELSDEESGVFRRGRNAKSYTTAKNATKIDYRMATGYEALIGYLYMMDNMDRIFYLVKYGLDKVQNDK